MADPEQIYAQALHAAGQRDWPRARALALDVLRISPQQGGMHYVAGVASLELGYVPQAVEHLRLATRLEPERANFAAMYARALSQAQRPSLDEASRALALSPKDPTLLMMLGMVFSQGADHRQATEAFRRAAELMPGYVPNRFALASSYIFLGDMTRAERELDQCLELDPTFWKAYLARSQLKRQRADSHHIDELQALLARQQDPEIASPGAQVCLHLALAKELEDLGRYSEAFEHMAAGKAAGRRPGYSSEADAAIFDAMRRSFEQTPGKAGAGGHTDDAPIFVLGMPRSGTTLVDRIISSHPDVHSGGELNSFPLAFKQLSGSRTPRLLDLDTIERSRQSNHGRVGAAYVEHARISVGEARRFIDKLPHNFLYIGAIARALPHARIICLRRHPLDTCLSNLRQLFGEDSPFHDYSYDLLDIGRHYIEFDRLMAWWKQQLPDRVLEVNYEDLVMNQEAVTRRMLAHCDLSWNDACLRFEQNEAPVASASAVQVRQPIHRSSLDHWRHFEPELAALKVLLAQAGIRMD
jgi:cytochrome c-type biogenesis protein CcmH/NrfG